MKELLAGSSCTKVFGTGGKYDLDSRWNAGPQGMSRTTGGKACQRCLRALTWRMQKRSMNLPTMRMRGKTALALLEKLESQAKLDETWRPGLRTWLEIFYGEDPSRSVMFSVS